MYQERDPKVLELMHNIVQNHEEAPSKPALLKMIGPNKDRQNHHHNHSNNNNMNMHPFPAQQRGGIPAHINPQQLQKMG